MIDEVVYHGSSVKNYANSYSYVSPKKVKEIIERII